jgi:hypothetical protein
VGYSPVGHDPVPVEVVFPPSTGQNRFTIFFRLLLAIPQFLLLGFFGIAAYVAVIVGWFAALILGRLPEGIDRFLGTFVQYYTRVSAYLYFLTGQWPPFDATTSAYPVHVIRARQPLNRLAVLFRIILVVPAALVAASVGGGLAVLGFCAWGLGVILGRLPVSFHLGIAAILRYQCRLQAYVMLLSPTYPWGLFGDRDQPAPAPLMYSPPAPPPPPAPVGNPWARYPSDPVAYPSPETNPSADPVAPPYPPAPADPYAVLPPASDPARDPSPVTRLVLTPGAVVVVALCLAFGVFANLGDFALLGAGLKVNSAVAAADLSIDYSQVSVAVNGWETQVRSCENSGNLACAEAASRTLSWTFGHFGNQIGGIKFPTVASVDAARLQQVSYRARDQLDAMASASDPTGFLNGAGSFAASGVQFDGAYRATEADLRSNF